MKLFLKDETQAEALVRNLSGNEKEKGLLDFMKKEKLYVNCSDPKLKDYRLNWKNGNTDLSLTLEEFWDEKLGLYKVSKLKFLDAFDTIRISDKKLGLTNAIFHHGQDSPLFLEYTPSILRSGTIHSLPRRNVKLKQNGRDLYLPSGHYMLK